jgi:hypothetical protein
MMQTDLIQQDRRHEAIVSTAVRIGNRVSLDEQSIRQGREHWVKACQEGTSVLADAIELSIDCMFDRPLF